MQLLRHFSQQHEDGVCGVATFKELIKLEYPKAFPDEHRAMLEFVTMLNAYEEAAATEAKVKQQQVEQLFRAIDADASGCIDEGEFVRELERASEQHGLSAEALVRLFRSKDVDGSGTLDMQEFVELVAESDMLNHRAAILHQGEAIRAQRQKDAEEDAARAEHGRQAHRQGPERRQRSASGGRAVPARTRSPARRVPNRSPTRGPLVTLVRVGA